MNKKNIFYLTIIILYTFFVCWLSIFFYRKIISSIFSPKAIQSEKISNKEKKIKHLGVIMDGNRRWAKSRNLPLTAGYEAGVEKFIELIEFSRKQKLESLTVYALSLDNIRGRTNNEIEDIYFVVKKLFLSKKEQFKNHNAKIHIIGNRNYFPADINNILSQAEEETKNNNGLNVFILFGYGPLDDLSFNKNNNINEMPEETYRANIRSSLIPNLDLVIRTGNFERLSGFLPVQSAYAELAFVKCMWPELEMNELEKLFENFSNITRNFGK